MPPSVTPAASGGAASISGDFLMSASDYVAWIGILLAVVGIGITVFFYVFDLRARLDKLADFQRHELNLFRAEHAAQLGLLMKRQEGILTKAQATNLLELYLSAVQHQLNQALDRYEGHDFPEHFASGNLQVIMFHLNKLYTSVVRDSLRKNLSHFQLRGGSSFDELVTETGSAMVANGFESISAALANHLETGRSPAQFIAQVRQTLFTTVSKSRSEVTQFLSRLYQN